MARVTQSRVEIRWSIEKEGARPNGLHYDPASDQLLIVDQGDGDLITIEDPRGARRESVFRANSGKPSGVVSTDFGGQDTIFMASPYNLALTQVRGEAAIEVDIRGVGNHLDECGMDALTDFRRAVEEGIHRVKKFSECGADAIMIEGIHNINNIETVRKEVGDEIYIVI